MVKILRMLLLIILISLRLELKIKDRKQTLTEVLSLEKESSPDKSSPVVGAGEDGGKG